MFREQNDGSWQSTAALFFGHILGAATARDMDGQPLPKPVRQITSRERPNLLLKVQVRQLVH